MWLATPSVFDKHCSFLLFLFFLTLSQLLAFKTFRWLLWCQRNGEIQQSLLENKAVILYIENTRLVASDSSQMFEMVSEKLQGSGNWIEDFTLMEGPEEKLDDEILNGDALRPRVNSVTRAEERKRNKYNLWILRNMNSFQWE